uniref:Uncharacterized protein n=1 Tax=Rhizophora mucronata TaxID=61149 RepID=A0A2P2R010_RHIMU
MNTVVVENLRTAKSEAVLAIARNRDLA